MTVAARLDSDVLAGIMPAEAQRRLDRYGPNRLATTGATPWYRVLGRQFLDVLIGVLPVAAVVSFVVGELVDAATILAILFLNGLLGFVQEWRAEQALEALQRMLALSAREIRNGRHVEINAEEIVPGDIAIVAVGDRIPADLRIFQDVDLTIDESALTGESLSVDKTAAAVRDRRRVGRTHVDGVDGHDRHQWPRARSGCRDRHGYRVREDCRAGRNRLRRPTPPSSLVTRDAPKAPTRSRPQPLSIDSDGSDACDPAKVGTS